MLGLQVTVSNIPKTDQELTNCFVNIYKNILPIGPTTVLNDHDIGLSHFAKEPIRKADEIISARYHRTEGASIDISGSIGIKANRIPSVRKWNKNTSNNFRYPSLNLLITGVFNDLDEPLFWRHEIPLVSFDTGVTITDQDGKLISNNKYKIFKEADALTDTHDSIRTVVAHYFLADPNQNKYYLINYRDASGNIVQEVLDQKPLFTKFPSTASIFTWSQNSEASLFHYWVVQDAAQYSYSLPDDYGSTAFREYKTSYIHASLAPSLGPNEPWFINIPNFNWIREDESLFKLPEWELQNFCSTAPYLCAIDDVSTVLGKHLIQVSNIGVLKSNTSLNGTDYIKLLLFQENDDLPTKAITNDSSLDGSLVDSKYEITWEYSELSVIWDLGIIYSPLDIGFYSWCYADYPYESQYASLYLRDLNPFRDNSLRGNTVVFYVVPHFTGQDRSIEYIIYDEDLVVVATSQDGIASNNESLTTVISEGLLYSLPEGLSSVINESNTLGLQVQVTSLNADDTFINKYIIGKNYIILGEFSYPETLDESANSLITDIREQKQLDPIEVRLANPDQLTVLSDSVYNELLQMPKLISTQEYRCHWALFTDYNSSALYSKNNIKERLKRMKEAGITGVITYEGVPTLGVQDIDIVNKQLTIHWLPVPNFNRTIVTAGILYQGTQPSSISTTVGTINDLAKTSSYVINFSSEDELYFKIVPQVTIDSVTYTGPDSNVLYFSFKR